MNYEAIPKILGMTSALLLVGCSCGEEKARAFCADKQGVAGYQDRYGVPVVVCNDGNKKALG